MREDPDLGFHKRKYINVVPISAADASASTTLNIDEDGAGGNEDGENASIGDLAEDAAAKLEDKDKLIDIDNESVTESKDVINNVTEEKNAVDDDASSTREVDEGEVDALAVSSSTEVKVDENIQETFAENPLETAASDEPDSANQQTDFSAVNYCQYLDIIILSISPLPLSSLSLSLTRMMACLRGQPRRSLVFALGGL